MTSPGTWQIVLVIIASWIAHEVDQMHRRAFKAVVVPQLERQDALIDDLAWQRDRLEARLRDLGAKIQDSEQ